MTTNEKELQHLENTIAMFVWNVESDGSISNADIERLDQLRRRTGKTWDAVNRCWRPFIEGN